ncbi:MAG: tetratricopeptide repeat protein [Acidimicrobiaceae bacterium]|nr:tetratricopeptide repeat protein [Acidimicrobiaceae bacterium]MYG99545.1 tetratricopeptide repeat protein [Acidimicrobiaceae bacterium]MYL04815.1 tetratricopeptide repeat protein [Acidimicrobiaceae bacterium]
MSAAGLPDLGPVRGEPASVEAWARGWEQYLHYRGDPVAVMSEAGERDESFVMGPVFASVYRVLAGTPVGSPALAEDAARVRERAGGSADRERVHARALELLVAGEFTAATRSWEEIAAGEQDFAAVRFAHDVYLHVGEADARLASSSRAVEAWRGEPGWGFVAGQHAFALEEVGRYDEAEDLGRQALSLDPDDLWARHALAHVYESTDDTPAARELLEGSVERWNAQELFATHIWWHLALRLLAAGDAAGALAVFDERRPHAKTAFQLCDQTSLLWRLELGGCNAGDRWDGLADRWDGVAERHTCGFLDVHAAVAFARRPQHPGARLWFEGLAEREAGASENDTTFAEVVAPLVEAFRSYGEGGSARFVRLVDGLGSAVSRIGGSIAQRDLIPLTRQAAERQDPGV